VTGPAGSAFIEPGPSAGFPKYESPLLHILGVAAPHLLMGRLGERIACRYLLRLGYDILARRYQARRSELDLVAFEGGMLVFIEVKTRRTCEFGEPWEFVDWEKRQRLQSAADEFIARYDLGRYTYRFDIVSVVAPGTPAESVSLFRNAV
jgi:putative endonuclease